MATFLVAETGYSSTCIVTSTNATFATARAGGTLATASSAAIGISGAFVCAERWFQMDLTSIFGTAISAVAMYSYATTDSLNASDELRCWPQDWGGGAVTTGDYVPGANLAALTEYGILAPGSIASNTFGQWTLTGSNLLSSLSMGGQSRILICNEFMETNTATVSSATMGNPMQTGSLVCIPMVWWAVTTDATGSYTRNLVYAGRSSIANEVSSGNFTCADVLWAQQGDLMVHVLPYRSNAAFTKPAGWSDAITAQNSGNAIEDTGIGSLRIDYIVRGASAPALTWTRTAGDVAAGTILLFRPHPGHTVVLDANNSLTMAAANTTMTLTSGVTTTRPDTVLIFASSRGDNNGTSAYAAANGSPSSWTEYMDQSSTSGADYGGGGAFGYMPVPGSTGNITATQDSSTRAALGVAAFAQTGLSDPPRMGFSHNPPALQHALLR